MLSKNDSDKPLTKEEAPGPPTRPPPEKYDPDELPYWSITMTGAWIIWGDLDHVRDERDDDREECADWHPERLGSELLAERIADKERTGDARRCPDSHKKLLKRREELIEAERGKQRAWHSRQWPPSSWGRLSLRAISEAVLKPRQQAIPSPQDAMDELWHAAEEDEIKATALAYESVKAYTDDLYAGNPTDIPAIHWKYLKFDPSGRPILLGPGGRVYGDVQFRRLSVKEQWPPLSVEPFEPDTVEVLPEPLEPERVETPEPTRQTEPELLESKGGPAPTAVPKELKAQPALAKRHIDRLYPDGTDISSEVIRRKLEKDPVLLAELALTGGKPPSRGSIDRARGLRT